MANMNTSEKDIITSLENKIDFIDKVVWTAVAISVILSGFLFSYKSKLADAQKKEIFAQQERIAQIELGIVTANKTVEDTKIETEKEKLKRLELQKMISPREIDSNELAHELSQFKNFGVLINWLADIETGTLVEQFKESLDKAKCQHRDGFVVTSTSSSQYLGIKIYGNTIEMAKNPTLVRFINTIHSHFIKHNIQAEIVDRPLTTGERSPEIIEIQFGLKPLVKIKK